ncbi:helix-turn-helix domain-containing protein [Marinicella sp. W31]|uniref:helix-turn-helix domain-containing protein n=1 Tax=Marinicella sp. W31 TaxID=3023713 RepID=UPI0037581693
MGDFFSGLDITLRASLMLAACAMLMLVSLGLFLRNIEARSSRFLGGFLLVVGMSFIPQIIGFSGFYQKWPELTFLPINNVLLLPGLLYLHAYTLMYDKPIGRRYWLLLPGILQFIYYLTLFLIFDDYRDKWAFSKAYHTPYIFPLEVALAVILFAAVFYVILRDSNRYQRFLEHTESIPVEFKPVWLKQMIYAFSTVLILLAGLNLYEVLIAPVSYVNAYPLQLLSVVALSWFGLQAINWIRQPYPKFRVLNEKPQQDSAEKWLEAGQSLKEQVIDHAWYLEPRINLSLLARRMATNETYISKAINTGLGMSFSAFINEQRVQHALKMMQETQLNILDIALQSGFNSKASFNRVFKEHQKVTPSVARAALAQ